MFGVGVVQGPASATSSGREASILAATGLPVLKEGIKLHLFDEGRPLSEKFRVLADLGDQGVELQCPNDQCPRLEVLRVRDQTGPSILDVLNAGNWDQPLSSPDPKVREKGAETLRAAIQDAGAYGASTVLLGPIKFAMYIDAFDGEHVGAYLDIGNTITNGWPEHGLRVLRDRVVKIDVKDPSRERFNGRVPRIEASL